MFTLPLGRRNPELLINNVVFFFFAQSAPEASLALYTLRKKKNKNDITGIHEKLKVPTSMIFS
jgi:hypothetical protein